MEKSISDMRALVDEIYNELKNTIEECSFMMFGHSLGTKVAYELALKIYNEKKIWPKCIIVSGGKAPNLIEKYPICHLNDERFIEELIRRYSSIPDEIAQSRKLMNVFLPTLRADFIMDENYRNKNINKLGCPIMGLIGTDDDEMTLDDLIKWRDFTNNKFDYKYIQGKHMFINTNRDEVIYAIKDFMKKMSVCEIDYGG